MDLNYFVGKYCTISTTQINFRFNPEIMISYFSGFINEIDTAGILMTHHITQKKNFIKWEHVVGIHEEVVLREDDPQAKKIIEQYKKEKPETAAKMAVPPETSQFVNPKQLAEVAKKAKELQNKFKNI